MIFLGYLYDDLTLFHRLVSNLISHLLHEEHRPVGLIDVLTPDVCLQLQLILNGFLTQCVLMDLHSHHLGLLLVLKGLLRVQRPGLVEVA